MSCPLLPLSVGTDTPAPPKAANVHAHLERKLASSGAPLYRRQIYRQQAVKKERRERFIFTLRLENAIIMLYICVQKGGGNLKKKIQTALRPGRAAFYVLFLLFAACGLYFSKP